MRLVLIAPLILLAASAAYAQERAGELCVLRIPPPGEPLGAGHRYQPVARLQLDDAPEVEVTQAAGILVQGLALGVRHRLVFRAGGRVVGTSWFRFHGSRDHADTDRMTLQYDAGYRNWRLSESAHACPWTTDGKRAPR